MTPLLEWGMYHAHAGPTWVDGRRWLSVTSFPVEEATIEAIHSAMLAGELRCRTLVETYLRRIEALDRDGPRLNAIVSVCDQALGRAEELDEELAATRQLSGPLHGIPLLVKDCIETVDAPTTFGSIATADYMARQDAEVIRRLRTAGSVILAKTTLCDFGAGWFSYSSRSGDTKNPYALERDSGGSSAGSAAGVAANFATAAVGTDCGGSIRVPASFCNLVGLRPTVETVSRAGVLPLVAPQDAIGPLARSVADAARLLSVLADRGTRARSAGTEFKSDGADGMRGMRQTRIGVLRNAFGEGRPEMESVNDVVMRALETVAAAGAMLVDLRIPSLQSDLETTSMYVLRSRRDLDAFFASRPELPVRSLREIYARRQYDPRLDLIDAIVGGPELSATDPEYGRRHAAREPFTALLEGLMDEYTLDVLAYPTVQVLAPIRGDEPFTWTTLTFPTNTVIASQAWMPAMSLPVGFASGGPVGLELLARQHDEAGLLRVGAALEQLTRQRRPPDIVPAHE